MSRLSALRHEGRWIPWAFVGFFVIVVAANGIMALFAYTSWSGLETRGAYEKGLHYNEALARAEEQRKLGWRVDVAFTPTAERAGRVTVSLTDRRGAWLKEAEVRAAFVRPTQAGHDVALDLPYLGAGRYGARVALPLRGQWDLRISVWHKGERYRTARRIQVP